VKREWSGADLVAIILACALGLISVLILLATTIQIVDHESPDLTLSENATQILIAAIGGLTGLLGGYIGFNTKRGRTPPED
jgi:hypothetical protein